MSMHPVIEKALRQSENERRRRNGAVSTAHLADAAVLLRSCGQPAGAATVIRRWAELLQRNNDLMVENARLKAELQTPRPSRVRPSLAA